MLKYRINHKTENAPWVAFLHGAGGSSSVWFKQVRPFCHKYNSIFIDLRGHGKSSNVEETSNTKYNFYDVSDDVIRALDFEKINNVNLISLSIGTVIAKIIAEKRPDLIKTLILVGALPKLDFRTKFLFKFGNILRRFLPDMWLYRFFAKIVMPRKNHQESRNIFIADAQRSPKAEFKKWYQLMARDLDEDAQKTFSQPSSIPTLFAMGGEDYIFIPLVKALIKNHKSYHLRVIEKAGHVANVDKDAEFNTVAMQFIDENTEIDTNAQSVIFDLDGTILNSGGDLVATINFMRQSFQLDPLTNETIINYIGNGMKNLVKRALNETDIDLIEAEKIAVKYYTQNSSKFSFLYNGVIDFLKFLKNNKIRTAIVSNKPDSLCQKILKELNISEYFDVILGGSEKYKLKPDAEMLHAALHEMHCLAKNSVMIGDNWTDIEAGENAGCRTFFYTKGLGKITKIQPDIAFNEYHELIKYFEKNN